MQTEWINIDAIPFISGPVEMKPEVKWDLSESNQLGHFLEIVECLICSPFASSTVSLGPGNFGRPSIYVWMSALAFVRQLVGDDELFDKVLKCYKDSIDDAGKLNYLSFAEIRWKNVLDGCHHFEGVSGTTLLNNFYYKFGLLHPRPSALAKFEDILVTHGHAETVMATWFTMAGVISEANKLAALIRTDFSKWLKDGRIPKPNRISIADLLGDFRGETEKRPDGAD